MALDKRTRSPNYPALSLPDALERVQMIYRNQHTHAAPREVVVKSMGYTGINGASATAISALHKYGLLERVGEEVKISDRAMRYLHPNDDQERPAAIREAALEPSLFRELMEKFPGRLPNEEVLRNYLIRNGFGPGAIAGVILAYRDTMELVDREGGAYDSAPTPAPQEAPLHPQPSFPSPVATSSPPLVVAQNPFQLKGNERSLGRLDFDGGGFVQIIVGGDVGTLDALEAVDNLASWARLQAAKRTARAAPAVAAPTIEEGDDLVG
jgi:hypothetical protein